MHSTIRIRAVLYSFAGMSNHALCLLHADALAQREHDCPSNANVVCSSLGHSPTPRDAIAASALGDISPRNSPRRSSESRSMNSADAFQSTSGSSESGIASRRSDMTGMHLRE